jgi:hypothetical protein
MESIIARERLGQQAFGTLTEGEMKVLNKVLEKLIKHTQKLIEK